MDFTSEELKKVKKRISETMADVAKEQRELDDILLFLNTIEQSSLRQMSGSASSARSKKNKAKAKSVEEEKKEYERRRAEKEESLGRLWMKIHDLQEQERKLKDKQDTKKKA